MVGGNSQTLPGGLFAMPGTNPGQVSYLTGAGQIPGQSPAQNPDQNWGQTTGNSNVLPLFKELRARFLPLLSMAMRVRGTTAGRALEWQEVAQQMQSLADNEQSLPLAEGLERQDLEDCRLAVYTMVDEILLASPREGENSLPGWFAHSLQVTRLGNASGGEVFFHKLSDLLFRTTSRPDPVEKAQPAGPVDALAFQLAGAGPGSVPGSVPGHLPDAGGLFSERGLQAQYLPGQQAGSSAQQAWLAQIPRNAQVTRTIPVESLPSCIDSLYPDQPRSPAACSAMAALCLFALCLLYGFRGRLFGQQNALVANALCRSASGLLFRLMNATPVSSVIIRRPGLPKKKQGILRSPLLLFLLPVLLSGIWYLVCSEIVNKIPLP